MKQFFRFLAIFLLSVSAASALCPHEVLVLANDESIDSVLVAKTFMQLRGIPEQNLVRLGIPEKSYTGAATISTNAFTDLIWNPACKAVEERGLSKQILAWVYSTDFPFRVNTKPEISVTGLTFLRNRMPSDLLLAVAQPVDGKVKADPDQTMYVSPLFAGPGDGNAPQPGSKTFEQWRIALLDDMPLPAMFLGWTGSHGGNTVDEVLACLRRGADSDGTKPDAPFILSTNQDVRSTSRAWEFPSAVRELQSMGLAAQLMDSFPKEGRCSGFLTGMANLPASSIEFLPGAFAEHFTSHAATFNINSQTKLCEWIRRGATASSGTVTEPYAYWQKFPGSCLFVHQARGCTMIEAFYQSVRCPLQQMPVGDPLARPWGRIPNVRIEGLSDGSLSGSVFATATTDQPDDFTRFDWLVDGRLVGTGATFQLRTEALPEGTHRLRAVARSRGSVRHNGYAETSVTVKNLP